MRVVRHLLRLALIVLRHADAHPLAGRSRELYDFRRAVAVDELLLEVAGFIHVLERADLHAPAAAGADIARRIEHVDAHARDSSAPHARCLRRRAREVDDALAHERTAV